MEVQTTQETAPTTPEQLSIRIVDNYHHCGCSFWVAMYRSGDLRPLELFNLNYEQSMLESLTTHGLNEHEPVMVSDTNTDPARFLYLIPASENPQPTQLLESQIISTIRSWRPQRIGIYFDPELFRENNSHNLLFETVHHFIQQTDITDYFLLTGKHGFNRILNTALDIKRLVESDSSFGKPISVFH